jgi:integrase
VQSPNPQPDSPGYLHISSSMLVTAGAAIFAFAGLALSGEACPPGAVRPASGQFPASSNKVHSAIPDQRRRRNMSRRSGQNGRIEQHGKVWTVRFWLDVEGRYERDYKRVKICPVNGPGSLNKSERKRRAQQIIAEFGANSEEVFRKAEGTNLGTTFKEQAERWFKEVQTRKRRPIKPRTADAWATYLSYLNAQIGEIPLASVNNLAVKELIAKMASEVKKDKARFCAKTITNYVQVVKMVVASAVNDKGEAIYPVKWNHDFMDLPEVKDQRTPTFAAEEVSTIISKAEGQYQVLYALLAGTGLRIEEAFALQVEDIEGSVIRVRHSMWNGKPYSPKTAAGVREVDITNSLAELLHDHLNGRRTGFVFRTAAGTPLARSNVLRRSLHKILEEMGREKCGFHAFRRYRVTHLRKQREPEDLLRFWIGHADGSVTDGYSKVKEDVEFRRFTAEQAGLGFHIPTVAPKLPVAPIAPKTAGAEIALTA